MGQELIRSGLLSPCSPQGRRSLEASEAFLASDPNCEALRTLEMVDLYRRCYLVAPAAGEAAGWCDHDHDHHDHDHDGGLGDMGMTTTALRACPPDPDPTHQRVFAMIQGLASQGGGASLEQLRELVPAADELQETLQQLQVGPWRVWGFHSLFPLGGGATGLRYGPCVMTGQYRPLSVGHWSLSTRRGL
jgi:hypothetical protein